MKTRRSVIVTTVFFGSLLSIEATAAALDDFLREDQYMFCGVERYEDILETTCGWDASARAAGNCNAPQYQVAVGKRPIYKTCRSLYTLGDGGPLQATAPPTAPESVKAIWRLMKSLQPLAAEAVTVSVPSCYSSIKTYVQRTQKADHEFYFRCLDEREAAILLNAEKSAAGRLIKSVEKTLATALLQEADARLAVGELALLLEDEGSRANQKTVEELASRLK